MNISGYQDDILKLQVSGCAHEDHDHWLRAEKYISASECIHRTSWCRRFFDVLTSWRMFFDVCTMSLSFCFGMRLIWIYMHNKMKVYRFFSHTLIKLYLKKQKPARCHQPDRTPLGVNRLALSHVQRGVKTKVKMTFFCILQ